MNAGLQPFLSLALGLLGVALARIAFTTRQQRLGEKVGVLETVVITAMAMLIVGPIVWEHELGMTTSALVGLGAGWSSIALFDALGARVVQVISMLVPPLTPRGEGGAPMPVPVPSPAPQPDPRPTGVVQPLPGDMVDNLERMDQQADAQLARASAVPEPSEPPARPVTPPAGE